MIKYNYMVLKTLVLSLVLDTSWKRCPFYTLSCGGKLNSGCTKCFRFYFTFFEISSKLIYLVIHSVVNLSFTTNHWLLEFLVYINLSVSLLGYAILYRSSHRRCSIKKGSLRTATLFKKRLRYRCFPVNFAKFLRTPFLQNTSGRLLLPIIVMQSV